LRRWSSPWRGPHEVFLQLSIPLTVLGTSATFGANQNPVGAESDRTGAAAATAAAAGNGRKHLRRHLRFGGHEMPEHVCGARPRLAGKSAVRPDLLHATARLQAKVQATGYAFGRVDAHTPAPAGHRPSSRSRTAPSQGLGALRSLVCDGTPVAKRPLRHIKIFAGLAQR
jgi:hypothetical protein